MCLLRWPYPHLPRDAGTAHAVQCGVPRGKVRQQQLQSLQLGFKAVGLHHKNVWAPSRILKGAAERHATGSSSGWGKGGLVEWMSEGDRASMDSHVRIH
eukprot:362897-Chlamydomonas_euryale.AAC.7